MNNKYIRKTLKLFAIITFLSVGIFAQNSNKNVSQRWIPVSIFGEKIGDSKAFIEINETEKRLTGNAGCNRMFGSFVSRGKNIKFSGIGTTKMFCGDESIVKLETNLLRSLNAATRYQKSGDSLKFYAGKKLISSFKSVKQTAPDSAKLEDKKWTLESFGDKPAPKTETTAFLIFDKEKKSAGGNTSCNVFGGSYVSEGASVKITEIISTQRACVEDERMNVEREFTNGLQNADRFEIKNGKLYLYQGETLLLNFNGENK